MPAAKRSQTSVRVTTGILAFVAISVVVVSMMQSLRLAGDLGGDSSSSSEDSSSDYGYSSSDYSSDYGYSSSDYSSYASSEWYSYASSDSSYSSSDWGWYWSSSYSSSEYSSESSFSSSEQESSSQVASSESSSEQMSSSVSSSEEFDTINEDELVMSDSAVCGLAPYDNEVVSVVTDEYGNEYQLTKDDLFSWSNDPYHDAGSSSSQISGGASSEFVGIAICANVDRTVKVSAAGRTGMRKYTRTIFLAPPTRPPTRPGEKPKAPGPPVKRTIEDNVAMRCSRLEAEASAQREAKEAFINSCGNPGPCVSDTLCRDKGVVHDLSPKPLVYDTKVTEHRAVTAMACADNKAYAASATVKGECTSTRICENKDFSRR